MIATCTRVQSSGAQESDGGARLAASLFQQLGDDADGDFLGIIRADGEPDGANDRVELCLRDAILAEFPQQDGSFGRAADDAQVGEGEVFLQEIAQDWAVGGVSLC